MVNEAYLRVLNVLKEVVGCHVMDVTSVTDVYSDWNSLSVSHRMSGTE